MSNEKLFPPLELKAPLCETIPQHRIFQALGLIMLTILDKIMIILGFAFSRIGFEGFKIGFINVR